MIQAYKHNENHVLSAVPLEQLEKGSWINAAAPTLEELVRINELTGIPVDSLQTALDREERSHVELEDDYIFVVVNTPVVLETDAYDARSASSSRASTSSPSVWNRTQSFRNF